MSSVDLLAGLRASGDPLQMMAAEALVASRAVAERLQERVCQLETIAHLHLETIRNMQRAADEAASALYRLSTHNGDLLLTACRVCG